MPTQDELEKRLKEVIAERNQYHAELTDLKLKQLRNDVDDLEVRDTDKETRLRELEKIAVRSNTIYALATGGGLISIIMLFRTLLNIP